MAENISKRSIVYEILMDFKEGKKSASDAEREIAKAQAATDNWTKSLRRTANTLMSAFITREVIRFTKEMVKLGDEVLDVRGRFNQINKSGALLGNLRKDTKGLIDDLSLMKSAIKAENFRVPLGELGKLLEFARKRANDTGQSVERMTELILEGVGKKSVKSLQEFGLSAQEVNEELKRTPDFAKAIGNIAVREFARAGNAATDYGDEIQKLEVELQNLTQKTSVGFTILFGTIAKGLNQISGGGNSIAERVEGVNDLTSGIAPLAFQLTLINKVFEKLGVNIEKEAQDARDAKNANDDLSGSLDKLAQAFILPSQAGASIGEIKEQIKQLEEQLDTVVPNSKEADTIIGRIKELSALLPNLDKKIKDAKINLAGLKFALGDVDDNFSDFSAPGKGLTALESQLSDLKEEFDKQVGVAPDSLLKAMSDQIFALEIQIADLKAKRDEILGVTPTPTETKSKDITSDLETQQLAWIKNAEAVQFYANSVASSFTTLSQLAKDGSEQQIALAIVGVLSSQAQALAQAVQAATQSALTTGGAAIFSLPTFLAIAIPTVLGGFAQVMSILNQAKAAKNNVQGFAEGTPYLERDGHKRGKDTIPIMADEGERIIPRKENEENWDVYEAIRKGNFDDFIQKEYINPALVNRQFEKGIQVAQTEKDYSHAFYRQFISSEGTNWNTKGALKYLKSIDRKLTQSSSRYARP